MPRAPRIEFEGAIYHVMARGNRRRDTVPVPPVGQAHRLPENAPNRPKTRLATSYSYDPQSLQLLKSTAPDGTEVTYEYDSENRLAKVSDATGTRAFAYYEGGQITKETVALLTGADTPPIRYEIRRTYTPHGQPESVHLVGADGESVALDHKVDYSWNEHGQLASAKSLAGEFVYGYDEHNPALLTKMTGPFHQVETSYEPHRTLIASVTNRANGGTGILPVHRDGPPGPQPADPSLIDGVNQAKPGGARSPLPAAEPTVQDADGTVARSATDGSIVSSYVYANDLLGRRETISQGGEAFAMLKLGENKVDAAYNERSEVVGASYLRLHRPQLIRFANLCGVASQSTNRWRGEAVDPGGPCFESRGLPMVRLCGGGGGRETRAEGA